MTDKQKAELLMSWINAVIAAHGINEARRVWGACLHRQKPAAPPGPGGAPAVPPKPMGWLK